MTTLLVYVFTILYFSSLFQCVLSTYKKKNCCKTECQVTLAAVLYISFTVFPDYIFSFTLDLISCFLHSNVQYRLVAEEQ